MLTFAVFYLAFFYHHPTAIAALVLTVIFFAMVELGWFDWRA